MSKRLTSLTSLLFAFLLVFAGNKVSADDRETLHQYVSQLKSNPEDNQLREKIIKLALTLNPKPTIPEDWERFSIRGRAAMQSAKNENDYKDAVAEFEKAALAAPWLADSYNNLAVAQQKAGDYDKAVQNLKLYLLTAPDGKDAKAAKTFMYELEFKAEKKAKAKQTETAQAEAANQEAAFLRRLEGARFEKTEYFSGRDSVTTIDLRNGEVFFELHGSNPDGSSWWQRGNGKMQGHKFSLPENSGGHGLADSYEGTISEDGKSISLAWRSGKYSAVIKRVK